MAGICKKSLREKSFTPDPKHYYVVSYPKSGNTWVRFLLANTLYPESDMITFQRLGELIPDSHRIKDCRYIYDTHSIFNKLPVQLVKTHSFYSSRYQNVIVIVRDGRDVITSYYHWINARVKKHVPLSTIIRGEDGHGLWSEHVLGWAKGSCHKKLIVRYEDLLQDTAKELQRMLTFIELEVDPQLITRTIDLSSFEKMRAIEKKHGVFDGHIEAIKKIPFVRKGTSGDWRTLFREEDLEIFWKYNMQGMIEYGYIKEKVR